MISKSKKIICIIKFKNEHFTYEMEKDKTINDLYKLFLDNFQDINYPIMIRLISNTYPFEGKDFDKPLLSLITEDNEDLTFEVTKSYKCLSCSALNKELNNNEEKNNRNNYISKYCLTCNKYICNSCINKSGQNHQDHKLMDINPIDLKNSVKLWCIKLIADLSEQMTSFKKQTDFMNDKDFLFKMNLWKENILSKINKFENLIKDIFDKFQDLSKYYKNLEIVYNKLMENLIKSEREMNEEVFLENEKNKYKYFSFEEAEEQIQKLKNNFEEIEKAKKEIKTIIDYNNIKSLEKSMVNIPMTFDNLTKSTLMIMDNIETFESEKNDEVDIEKIFKYPDFLNTQLNNKPKIYSSIKVSKPKKIDSHLSIGNKTSKNKNKGYYISNGDSNINKITRNSNSNGGEKLITQITKLSDIPASYSIIDYSKYLKKIEENNFNPKSNIKIINLNNKENQSIISKKTYSTNNQNILELPKIINNNEKEINNINKSNNINRNNNKLFRSMDNKKKGNLKKLFF